MITLSQIEQLSSECEAGATPHRLPDFARIKTKVAGDPEVRGYPIFVEECNTGYDGVLYRWIFTLQGTDGEKIMFQADLFPDTIELNT